MRIFEIADFMEGAFPLGLQEKYDNAGPQLLFADDDARAILLALDVDVDVAREAMERDCNLIISHHPLLFRPLRNIVDSEPTASLLLELSRHRISVYASHTNLDKVYHGKLAEALGYAGGSLLLESDTKSSGGPTGFGVRIDLAEPESLGEVLKRVKDNLGLEYLRYCGDEDRPVRTLALLNGAGGGSVEGIIARHRPDCIVTGDVGYHHVKSALARGVAVIDAGHYGTEKLYLPFLKKDLEALPLKVFISGSESDPFRLFTGRQ